MVEPQAAARLAEVEASERERECISRSMLFRLAPIDAPRPTGPRSIARSVGLGAVAFSATLILLFGMVSIVGRSAGGVAPTPRATGTEPAPSQAIATSSASTAPSVSGDPVLVGAGDIADCDLDSGAATASLLDTIEGTVFTAGDNAYPNGSSAQFRDCYAPTWGRHLERTRPAAGNHDWETKDLAGYREYFGAAAGPDGASWYSYDLGTWHVIVLDSDCAQVGVTFRASAAAAKKRIDTICFRFIISPS